MRASAFLVACLALLPVAAATHTEPVPDPCEYTVIDIGGIMYIVISQNGEPDCAPEEGIWLESNGMAGWQGSRYHPNWDTHLGP